MWATLLIITTILATYLSTKKRYRWFYIIYKTFPRDFKAALGYTKLILGLKLWERRESTVAKSFSLLVKKHPHKIALYFEEEAWTFLQLEEFSNQIGNYFKSEGYQEGDTIALMFQSKPEYVGIWLGLSKIGVITALINYNLVNKPLIHSIVAANSKALIFGSEFTASVNGIMPKTEIKRFYKYNETSEDSITQGMTNLRQVLKKSSKDALPVTGKPRDKLLYIYTSGTTGLPKAAVITHLRFYMISAGVSVITKLRRDDIIYVSLPLYHSAGGVIGIGQCLIYGRTAVIKKKFSASHFWKDCVKYNCTVAQYIGETCRYLLAAAKDEPIKHSIRCMFGNGLKSQIWNKFAKQFSIPQIFEFYGSTEGNANLANIDNTVGAIGFIPRYAGVLFPLKLIKCNQITGEPVRDDDGFCIISKINEPGILIARISRKLATLTFSGYVDRKATQAKILENVFKKGDKYFNTGDILLQDELGYLYFKDRMGDTFRWKGENIATTEVEEVITNIIGLSDVCVYGVEIPGTEGRAGMAVIVDENKSLDIDELCKGLRANLPSVAVPLFLRIAQSVPTTNTFKVKKYELQEEGFNLNKISDDLYFYDAKLMKYLPLVKIIYEDIIQGKYRM